MNGDDLDRAAILARQRFIALALAGISGLAAESVLAAEPPAESVVLGREHDPRCELIGDDLPPLPSPTPPPETLSEAERYEQAKQRYAAAKQAHADGDYDQTIIELEAAYALAPDKHGLAFYIGAMAHHVDRWRIARAYLQHFLAHADPQKFPDFFRDAELILQEIAIYGCETVPDERAPSSAPEPCLSICRPSKVERNACEQKRERKARLREERRAERRKRRGQ
ncbi:MAG TPA: hypothetical protein VM869_31355 [Enhygromyxa sp.]|nr:hypothetical protein [Enhygromyxa sp.]